MFPVELKGQNIPIKLWANPSEVESEALDQLKNVAALPSEHLFKQVVGLPDIHVGKGATVGSVIATRDIVIPAAVGSDIGCGMVAVRSSLINGDLHKKDLQNLFDRIQFLIPVGFNGHDEVNKETRGLSIWDSFEGLPEPLYCWKQTTLAQMGTLGGGNHFIEVSEGTDGYIWIVLHSGSRRIGKEISDYFIKEAVSQQQIMPDRSLSYFTKEDPRFDSYLSAAYWAQKYASINRDQMRQCVMDAIAYHNPSVIYDTLISCHHNYISLEKHFDEYIYITRKGAIEATKGQMGIIPGAMGRPSYIVRGKGNPESFMSAPHGAGRSMSRSKAKKKYRKSDVADTMKGIICRTDDGVVDEICYAYKHIEKVIENAADLISPEVELRQLLCIKG